MEMGKRHYFSYHSNSCKEDKIFYQKHESFTFEIPLTKLSWLDTCNTTENVATSKRYNFTKRAQKLKTTFHNNFALKSTLMQIWKSANIFVFIWNLYVENFTLKHLLLFEICAREICEKFVYKHSETIEYAKN